MDFGRGTRPVVGVSWYDAQMYVGYLNDKTGSDDVYRLLTDAEWEYAARAGSTTTFPWGTPSTTTTATSAYPAPGWAGGRGPRHVDGRDRAGGIVSPNAFGLHDMHGNAFEWVDDCYEADRANARTDGSATKTGNCLTRMFRVRIVRQ